MYRGSVLVPHPLLEESENFKRILAEGKCRLGYFATLPRTSRRPRRDQGDPGAVCWVGKTSVVKVYCKIETSAWALTLTEPVPEAFELPASDWPEKNFFLPNQRRGAAG